MRVISFLCLLLFVMSATLASKNAKTKNSVLQRISSDINSNPVLSPNGRWLAFIKKSNYILQSDCLYFSSRGSRGNEIWMYDLKKMQERLLVANHLSCNDMSQVILDPSHLLFSPDNKTIYFETSAWVTSGAIHAVDVDGKNLRFVTDGNEYRVVMHGLYKGDLIVNQHRYSDSPGEGSYDWDWLFTPRGKQIKLYQKL